MMNEWQTQAEITQLLPETQKISPNYAIEQHVIDNAMTYETYTARVNAMIARGQSSSVSTVVDEEELHYAQLNQQRMNRLNKTTKLLDTTLAALAEWKTPVLWLVITEGWCGDAAQIVPVVSKMCAVNEIIKLRLIFRDEHPALMDNFLTNGGRAIPKIVAVDLSNNHWIASYGPRPAKLSEFMLARRAEMLQLPEAERKKFFEVSKTMAQQWYNENKTVDIQNGLISGFDYLRAQLEKKVAAL